MIKVRLATDADFRDFYEIDPPPIWLGLVGERDGRAIGFGSVVWNNGGQAIGFFACKEPISAFLMHRTAKRVIRILKEVGEPVLYASPHPSIPKAESWMKHLGFKPFPENPDMWRLDLT